MQNISLDIQPSNLSGLHTLAWTRLGQLAMRKRQTPQEMLGLGELGALVETNQQPGNWVCLSYTADRGGRLVNLATGSFCRAEVPGCSHQEGGSWHFQHTANIATDQGKVLSFPCVWDIAVLDMACWPLHHFSRVICEYCELYRAYDVRRIWTFNSKYLLSGSNGMEKSSSVATIPYATQFCPVEHNTEFTSTPEPFWDKNILIQCFSLSCVEMCFSVKIHVYVHVCVHVCV